LRGALINNKLSSKAAGLYFGWGLEAAQIVYSANSNRPMTESIFSGADTA